MKLLLAWLRWVRTRFLLVMDFECVVDDEWVVEVVDGCRARFWTHVLWG